MLYLFNNLTEVQPFIGEFVRESWNEQRDPTLQEKTSFYPGARERIGLISFLGSNERPGPTRP